MLKNTLVIFIYLLLIVAIEKSSAKDGNELLMLALNSDGGFTFSKNGTYDYMLKSIEARSGIEHDYKVTSVARGKRKFRKNKMACIIPSNSANDLSDAFDLIHSKPFVTINYHAVTLSKNTKIDNHTQLGNKVVGVVKHHKFWQFSDKLTADNVTIIEVTDGDSLTELLKAGRVDVAIHDQLNMLKMTEKHQAEFHFNPNFSPVKEDLVVTCHHSSLAQAYINHINPILENINKTGLETFYQQSLNH